MIIVLDTNQIRAHLSPESLVFLELPIFVKEDGHRLVVPDIVRRELAGHIAAELLKVKTEFTRFNHETKYTTDLTPPAETEQTRLIASLQQRLAELGAEDMAIPLVPHERVVDRIYDRKAPFTKGGKNKEDGYKDFLLWSTVLEIARANSGQNVVLVSGDRGFGQDNELHPHMVADADGLDIRLVSDLKAFHENEVQPWFSTDEGLRIRLGDKTSELTTLIQRHVEEAFTGIPVDPWNLHLPSELDSPDVVAIDEITDVRISSVRRLSATEIVATLLVDACFGMLSGCYRDELWDFDHVTYDGLNFDVDIVDEGYAMIHFDVYGTASVDVALRIEDEEIRELNGLDITEVTPA